MNDYRNIDDIVEDATICITIKDHARFINCSGIPVISDRVNLNISRGHAIVVEVKEISDDRSLFKGTVIYGYFPKNQNECIDAGSLVQFSRKKIAGIYKK